MGSTPERGAAQQAGREGIGAFARVGMQLADWSQKWFPDAFIFALGGTVIVFVVGLLAGVGTRNLIQYFGDGFWGLIPFTMQMTMIIIGGYVVATSPPVFKLIQALAKVPRTPRGAVAFVAFFSMATSLVSWGFGLIFAGVLARQVVRNVRGIDYRALGTAAYVGEGSVWALGLSSSAALVMATPGSISAALLKISGVIPLRQTIYTWQSATMAAILMVACVAVAYFSTPVHSTKDAESFGVTEGLELKKLEERKTPAEWLEYAPVLSIAVGVLGLAYMTHVLAVKGPFAALDLNTYNFSFLMIGLLLHWRPRSFVRAVNDAIPAVCGRADSISVLRRNFRDHHVFGAVGEARAFFRELFDDGFVSGAGRAVLGVPGDVRAVRREQMDYRSAVYFAGGQGSARESRMGRADLQYGGGFAESDQSVLDAAAAGPVEGEGARPDRLRIALPDGEFGAGVFFPVVFRADVCVCRARYSLTRDSVGQASACRDSDYPED